VTLRRAVSFPPGRQGNSSHLPNVYSPINAQTVTAATATSSRRNRRRARTPAPARSARVVHKASSCRIVPSRIEFTHAARRHRNDRGRRDELDRSAPTIRWRRAWPRKLELRCRHRLGQVKPWPRRNRRFFRNSNCAPVSTPSPPLELQVARERNDRLCDQASSARPLPSMSWTND